MPSPTIKRKYRRLLKQFSPSLRKVCNGQELSARISSDSKRYIFQASEELYICPMCMNAIYSESESYLDFAKQNNVLQEFSLDHYPPESVGGSKTILVCKKCNSTHGEKEDHAIKTHLQMRAFLQLKDDASFPISTKFEGIPGIYRTAARWENGTLVQTLNIEKAPLVKKRLDENTKNGNSWSLTIHGQAPSMKTLYKALLRTAYLFCFSKWGYDFAISPTAKSIRDVLTDTLTHPIKNLGVYFTQANTFKEGISLLQTPEQKFVYLVGFPISIQKSGIYSNVFVVVPTRNGWGFFETLPESSERIGLTGTLYEIKSNYVELGEYFGYSKMLTN